MFWAASGAWSRNEPCMATVPTTGTPVPARLDGDGAAEAIADHGDARRINHRTLLQHVEAGLGTCAHERAVLVVERRLGLHFLHLFRPDVLAENVGGEDHVAELREHLRVLAGEVRRRRAGAAATRPGACR